jgi:pimeloyl-ACP methyl ester carboxylesterase
MTETSKPGTGYFHNRNITTRYRIEGSGPTVVLVHGVGGRLDMWEPIVPHLSDRFRVIRYDLRGFGQSTKVKGRYEVGSYIEDFAALMHHLKVDRCHLVGQSLGGIIAQGIALVYGDMIDRLVLSSTIGGVNAEDRAFLRERYLKVREGADAQDHFDRSLDTYFSPEYLKAHPDAVLKEREARKDIDPECFAAAYRIIAETDMIEDLHRIKSRTLVQTGEFDRASPQMAEAMAREIPDSEVVIYKGLRHRLVAEAPDLVGQTVRNFLLS